MAKMSEMRLFVMGLYPDKLWWHEKVQKMPTKQIYAIYEKYKENKRRKKPEGYHQIDMFEYMATLTQNHTEVNT